MLTEIVQLSKESVIQIAPEISVAYGAWGKEVTNDDLLLRFPGGDERLISATKFYARHQPYQPTPFLENRERIKFEMIEVGTNMIQKSLKSNGWDSADLLIVSSSSPPDDNGRWVEEIAAHTKSRKYLLSYLACNGAGAAILETLMRKELADWKIVILADEVLGNLANPNNLADLAIFGTGAAALSYRPRNIKLFHGKTVIIPDKIGVMRSPKTYHLPPQIERVAIDQIPVWYELRDGAESIFAYSEKGVFIALPKTEGLGSAYMQMDGEKTALAFKYMVPQIQLKVLREYYDLYGRENPITCCISHQPSGVVSRQTNRELRKLIRNAGLPPVEDSHWVMDQVGMGNVSSATSLIAFAKLAPALQKGERFLFSSYGIGSATTIFIGELMK